MFQQKRFARIALLDPVYEVAYSRTVRRGARYVEDETLCGLLWEKGLDVARQYALVNYQGVQVAVFVQ